MKRNNEEMNKDQPSSSHQQEIVCIFFVPPKKLRYISFHPPELITCNLFEGTKTRTSLSNINEHCTIVSHIDLKSYLEAKKGAN
jgi:hypothetical protein